MSQLARIVKLYNLLKERQPISAEALMDELEASRATVMRDIELLRDQLNLPIAYDRDKKGYGVDNRMLRYGPRYELPGMWLTSHEAYALLTLINVLQEIGLGLVMPFIMPMRRMLKLVLSRNNYEMLGLDRKISIELGDKDKLRSGPHLRVSGALTGERRLHLEFTDDSGADICGDFSPQRLALTGEGWFLDAWCHTTDKIRRISMPAINEATLLDEPAKIINM